MASRPRPANDAALNEVRAVYDEVAARPVERACIRRTECCQFHITGRVPQLTRGEALVAAKALRASGRTRLPERTDGACPMLDAAGRCIIYEARPFGCRTHFCAAAGGPYARRDVLDLIRRLERVDEQLGGEGALPLPGAVRREL
ncbi:MAG: YkgJ family cysteine cluster protein [Chthoniobacteraceae bacterium]